MNITVNAPARAWDGAELGSSIDTIECKYQKKGKGGYYKLTLDRASAMSLMMHCEMAYWRDWETDSVEKEALKALATRILRALGIEMNPPRFYQMPKDAQSKMITGIPYREWLNK